VCEKKQHGQIAWGTWLFGLSLAACFALVILISNTEAYAEYRSIHVTRMLDHLSASGKIDSTQYSAAQAATKNISVLEVVIAGIVTAAQSLTGLGLRLLIFLLVGGLGFGGRISPWRLALACSLELPARMIYYYLIFLLRADWIPQVIKESMLGVPMDGYGVIWNFLYVFTPSLIVIPLMCMLAEGEYRKLDKAGLQAGVFGCLCLIIIRVIPLLYSGCAMLIDWI